MKDIVRFGLGMSAGIVSGRIIFGLSREYCSNGLISGFGTGALVSTAFVYGYSLVVGTFDGIFKAHEEHKEDGKNG